MGSVIAVRNLLWPLWGRMLRGEGGLAVCAILIAWSGNHAPLYSVLVSVLAIVLLWSLYLLNDYTDIDIDLANPKKDQAVVQWYIRHRDLVAGTLWLSIVATVALAALIAWHYGQWSGFAAAGAVLCINAAYSYKLKATPFWDILIVGIWGGTFAAIVTQDIFLLFSIAAMTALAHCFQILEDAKPDAQSGVITSAVQAAGFTRGAQCILAFAVGAALVAQSQHLICIAGAVAIIVSPAVRANSIGWLIAKTGFVFALAVILFEL